MIRVNPPTSPSKKSKKGAPPVAAPGTGVEDKENELRERLYKEHKEELVKKQISNAENFDKSVLTLSTSALGFSVAFIKDFAPLATADERWMLPVSWCLFGGAAISTMVSFMTSHSAVRHQLGVIQRYYIEREDAALKEASSAATWTNRLNSIAGSCLVAGLSLTVAFAIFNLPSQKMNLPSIPSTPAPVAPVPPVSIDTSITTSISAGQPTNQIRPIPTNTGK